MKIQLVLVLVVTLGYSVTIDAQYPPCTWDDIVFCEKMLTQYTRDPRNWGEDRKSIFYCDFVRLRSMCLKNLRCDISSTTEEMPIDIDQWAGIIEDRYNVMINYGLCSEKPNNQLAVDYGNPCDEFYVFKNCSEHLAEYLMSRHALTCVAMLKAGKCFATLRNQCGLPQPPGPGGVPINPYGLMASTGHCQLYYDAGDPIPALQEQYRADNGLDYFAYF